MSLWPRLWSVRSRFLWSRFEKLTERPQETQAALLTGILGANRGTAFGRGHGFGHIATTADYQAAVPVRDFEGLRPWIDRVEQGEPSVLASETPYMFAQTSGTTGLPKLIPLDSSSHHSARRLSQLWLYRALRDHPSVLDGKALIVVSPAVEGHTPSGIPYGSSSGYIYRHASWALRKIYALPYSCFAIKDYESKYYAVMRLALERDVSLLATPNPSTLLRLFSLANQRCEDLVRDIHDGTLVDLDIASSIRLQLTRRLKPNPKRAADLERIVNAMGYLDPRACWPHLALVGCWKGGSVGVAVERLQAWLPGTPVRDLGFLASEAQMSVPIQDEGSAGVLAVNTNFYEFIPEEEMSSDSPWALTASELDAGQSYRILITSRSGLYRYDINDIVKVVGHHNRTPMIEFVRKGRDMVSLTGEKLHVGQLIAAIEAAQKETGVAVAHFRATGNSEASRYDIMIEPSEHVNDLALSSLAGAIDRQLAALNVEYAEKRSSARLGPTRVLAMREGWYDRRIQAKLAAGNRRDTQFKDALLGLPDAEDDPSEVERTVGG